MHLVLLICKDVVKISCRDLGYRLPRNAGHTTYVIDMREVQLVVQSMINPHSLAHVPM